jgi:predicted HTH transcriptional regulator
MRRIKFRFIVLIIILAYAGIQYLGSDWAKCNGPRTEDWLSSTTSRLEMTSKDINSISSFTPASHFRALKNRAQNRYTDQQNQDTPACLSELQEITMDGFYYEWKAYEAASNNDFTTAQSYMENLNVSKDKMEREIYRLASKYGWDFNQ